MLVLFLMVLPGFPAPTFGSGDDNNTEIAEGQHPLYIVKEIVEVTSDWAAVEWVGGLRVLAVRQKVVEGSDAPEFRYEVSPHLRVWVAKRSYNTTRVVIEIEALALRGDESTLINVSKGNIEYAKVILYAYSVTARSFEKLAEFLNDGTNPMAFALDLSTLYAMPSAKANVKEAVGELRKNVLAFYYPWYANPAGPSRRWFHWTETGSSGVTYESIAQSEHYPLLGAYDIADEAVVLAHMYMARQAGIDGFIVSWWGIDTFEDTQMTRILSLADRTGLKATIYYETTRDLTLEDVVTELTYVLRKYAAAPSFLKDSGRHVVFIYAVLYAGRDPSFWLEVRRRVEASAGPVVLIGDVVGHGYRGFGTGHEYAELYMDVFDGFHSYIFLGEDVRWFYRSAVERLRIAQIPAQDIDEAFTSAYSGEDVNAFLKSVSLTAAPGNDLTKIGGDASLFRDRKEGEFYAAYWRTAIELDVHSVLITSWNEWHEGTEIEPSREYGFDYIRLTRRFVEEYKQASLPTPKASFSATVKASTEKSTIVLEAATEVPALIITIEIKPLEGVSDVEVRGEHHAYLKDRTTTRALDVVTLVPPRGSLVIEAPYRVSATSPALELRITAYDPAGDLYKLFDGQVTVAATTTMKTTTMNATTFTTTQTINVTLTKTKPPETITKETTTTFTATDIKWSTTLVMAVAAAALAIAVSIIMARRIKVNKPALQDQGR